MDKFEITTLLVLMIIGIIIGLVAGQPILVPISIGGAILIALVLIAIDKKIKSLKENGD